MNKSSTNFIFLKPLLRAYFDYIENYKAPSLLGYERPLWRDTSSWQKKWNADIAWMNGVMGHIGRAGHGLVIDEYFPINDRNTKAVGMFHSSYWAIYPNLNRIQQLDLWYRQHPEIENIPRVIDMEVSGNLAPVAIGDYIWKVVETIYQRDGVYPILYSRYLLINSWCALWTPEMLNSLYYWLAQYLKSGAEHDGPPTLPNKVRRANVFLHQTSDHKVDFIDEAESLSIDWNRGEQGNRESMIAWIHKTWGNPMPLTTWYQDVDNFLRRLGFNSPHPYPGGLYG